jgi:hypothetical protein
MLQRNKARWLALWLLSSGCSLSHSAVVRTAALPPPPDPVVRHSSRLWLELFPGVIGTQCVTPPASRKLCFEQIDGALAAALGRSLWTSFPGVNALGHGDSPEPGDYVLTVELSLDALPPNNAGPGWAALARGRWQLVRDDRFIAGESVESRSRADFPYGAALGDGAGEVVDAIALHVGMTLGGLAESRPEQPLPLPPVVAHELAKSSPPVARAQ